MRLQKFMAHAGIASRRKSEQIIKEGRVKINGQVITELGTKVNLDKDFIEVDGQTINLEKETVCIMLNKPKGYITSKSDEKGRKTVMDLVSITQRVYPVGRLDFDSRGLVLLTNYGELAYRLLHPKYEVPKTYIVKINKQLTKDQVNKMISGIKLEEGLCRAKYVDIMDNFNNNSNKNNKGMTLKVILTEGRKRQVKKMIEELNAKVYDLQRIKFASLKLGGLSEGESRYLKNNEIKNLEKLVGLK